MKKLTFTALAAVGLVVGMAGPALAHDCVNLSINPNAVQVVIGVGEECADTVTLVKNGIVQHLTHAQVQSFHGPLGIDLDCDGKADVVSYEPGQGTDGVVPGAENPNAKNVAQCKGVTNFETAGDAGCFGPPT
ncbi:MAG: hypothetical protein U0W40_05550 [Acidimicrobiia bacterium]